MRCSLLLLALLLTAVAHAQAPSLTLTSPNPETNGFFGGDVSGVPDADGDGYDDLLVSATAENGGATDAGRVYLLSGATGTLLHTLTSPNPESGGRYGFSVSGVPDVNGDGRGDLLVGADLEDNGASNAGRAYLVSGATGTLLHTLTSPNPESSGYFGVAVAGVPDADGDGRADLLVGAYTEDGGASNAGRAHLFSGATGLLLRTLTSPNPGSPGFFGISVSGVPDVDGDGRGDLLVGADAENAGAPAAGRAYLFSGATGVLLRTLTSPNPESSGRFGNQVSGIPDADGDGRDDLLIGVFGEDGGPEDAGRAYLFSGATGALLRTLTSPNAEVDGAFGSSVKGVTDVDEDGHGDLVVGAYSEDDGETNSGRVYLFSGATGALLRTLTSPNAAEGVGYFGGSVAEVMDVDGDGRSDLLIGAYNEDGGAEDAGRAYLFSGASSGSGIIVSVSGTPTTISPGGTVTVTATATNNTAQPAPLDLWIVATRGLQTLLTRLIGSGTLPAGATGTLSFALRAPSNTPAGDYTLVVNVGDFQDGLILASDALSLTVMPTLEASVSPAVEPFAVVPLSGNVFATDRAASPTTSPSPVVVSPNPSSGQTVVRFTLGVASHVRLSIHDVLGREVAVLMNGEQAAGVHSATLDASSRPAGVYAWRFAVDGEVQTGWLTVVR